MLFLVYPVEPTEFLLNAAHSKYSGKREHQCGEDVVYIKTETKLFTQNAYYRNFYITVALASRTREWHVLNAM